MSDGRDDIASLKNRAVTAEMQAARAQRRAEAEAQAAAEIAAKLLADIAEKAAAPAPGRAA